MDTYKHLNYQIQHELNLELWQNMSIILILIMSIIQKLLTGTPETQLKDFQSSIQLHLKQILTTINKHILEDMTQSNIRKHKCIVGCYDYHIQDRKSAKNQDHSLMWERVQQLRTCKQKCLAESKDIEKFLDNINFYSKKKFMNCSSSCYKAKTEEQQNTCLWQCYNRLDRRYKQYWTNQKQNIEAKYKI